MSRKEENNRIPTVKSMRWVAQSRQNLKKGGHVLFKFKLLDQTGLELRITDASFVCFDFSFSRDGTPNDSNGMFFEIGAIPNGISSRKIWMLLIVQLCYVENNIIPISSKENDPLNKYRILDLPFDYNEESEDSIQPVTITKKNEIELYLRIFEDCERANVPYFNLVVRAIDRRKRVESNAVTLVSRNFIVHSLDKTNRWIHFKNKIDIKKLPCLSEDDNSISFPENNKQYILPPDYISILELCEEFIIHEHPSDINSFRDNLVKIFLGSSGIPFEEPSLNFLDTCLYIIENIGSESTDTIQATLLKILNLISSHCPECSLALPNFQDINRMSLLHHCCITGYIKLCKYLISLHADVNLKDSDHNTPLHYAAEGGFKNLSSLLIFHGAEVDTCNIFGETPISLALKDNRLALRDMLEKSLSNMKHIRRDISEFKVDKSVTERKKEPKTPYLQILPPDFQSIPSSKVEKSNTNDIDSIVNSAQKKLSISSENIKRHLTVMPRSRAPSDPQKNLNSYPKKVSTFDSIPRPLSPLTVNVKKGELNPSWENILRSVGMKSNELITNDEIVNSISHHLNRPIKADSMKKESNDNNLLRSCHPSSLVAKLVKISEGGESDVYIGLLISRMDRVLINTFSIQTQNPASLYNEIEIMSILKDNPRTLKIVDAFTHNYKAWVITECLQGCTLKDLLDDKSVEFNEPVLRYIMNEIVLSLVNIHQNNIVYRNLELNNIFVCNDGSIKLVDMSLAHYNPKTVPKGKSLKISDFDFRMDIWSIGVVGIQLANHSIKNEPLSVKYMTNNPGIITNHDLWSEDFIDFLSSCKEHYPSSQESEPPINIINLSSNLLSHNFLKGEKDKKSLVIYVETLIKKQKYANFPWCRRM